MTWVVGEIENDVRDSLVFAAGYERNADGSAPSQKTACIPTLNYFNKRNDVVDAQMPRHLVPFDGKPLLAQRLVWRHDCVRLEASGTFNNTDIFIRSCNSNKRCEAFILHGSDIFQIETLEFDLKLLSCNRDGIHPLLTSTIFLRRVITTQR